MFKLWTMKFLCRFWMVEQKIFYKFTDIRWNDPGYGKMKNMYIFNKTIFWVLIRVPWICSPFLLLFAKPSIKVGRKKKLFFISVTKDEKYSWFVSQYCKIQLYIIHNSVTSCLLKCDIFSSVCSNTGYFFRILTSQYHFLMYRSQIIHPESVWWYKRPLKNSGFYL